MPSLFDKRLLICSGKGGAGKSTVAAAIAVAAARRGKRVLIVEVGDEERISAIFRAAPVGYAGRRVYESPAGGRSPIWSMCLTPHEALREYALRSMKFEAIYQAVFENAVLRHFTAAAPGLDEITILGKIESLHREKMDPAKRPSFDLMVFDAPATGHGLALFKVIRAAMTMTRRGLLHAKLDRIWQLLVDARRTALNIVALPEEMSVSESIDLHKAAEEMGVPRGAVIVNGVAPDILAGSGSSGADLRRIREASMPSSGMDGLVALAVLDGALVSVARRAAHDEMIAKLAQALPQPRLILPFVFAPGIGPAELELLANHLEGL